MTDARDFTELVARAKKRVGDRTDLLPYAIFEEISSPYVVTAARLCAFPLSLTDDLASKLLDSVSMRFSMRLGDMASVLIDILRSSDFVINGSGERWRYEQKARDYFLRCAKEDENFAKRIHRWLLDYYAKTTPPPQDRREAWTQQLRTAYHQTPLEPKTGAEKYADLFEDYGAMIFRERVSTLIREQADWLEDYSVGVLFYQGMVHYKEGWYEETKGFFEQIHDHEPLLAEARLESSPEKVRDQIVTSPRYYEHVAVARHLLGNITEHEPEHDDVLVETLYRDSLDMGRILQNTRHVAHVGHSLGDLLARRSDPESLAEAENLLRRSLDYDEGDDYHVASVQLSLGTLLFKIGPNRYDEAIKRFENGLERAHAHHLKIRLQLGLGRVLAKRGRDDWGAAEQAFVKALDLSRESEHTWLEIQTLREMLSLATLREDWAFQTRIQEQLSEAYLKNGSQLTATGNWADATKSYLEHIRLSQERDEVQAVATANVELGRIYIEQDNFESAKEAFEEALSIARQHHDQSTKAEAQLGLSRILNKAQSWEEAIALLQNSLAIFAQLRDLIGEAKCNAQLGEAYIGQFRLGSALRKLEAARESFEQLGRIYDAAKTAVRIAFALDLHHNYRKALTYARWGLEELLKLGHEDAYDVELFVNSLRRKVAQTDM